LRYFKVEKRSGLSNTSLVSEKQYGFKKGVSLRHQHIDIQNTIFDALNNEKILAIHLLFLDSEKAFERIPISLLIGKMKKYNIDHNL
jgi:hypothetical protein